MELEIPYTIEPRVDTGLYNGKLGVWLFLASEAMLFGALFSAYVLLRTGATAWPHGWQRLSVPLGALNTVALLSSSLAIALARRSLLREAGALTTRREKADPAVRSALASREGAASGDAKRGFTLRDLPKTEVEDANADGHAEAAEAQAGKSRCRWYLTLTFGLALVFLAVKLAEYREHLIAGEGPSRDAFFAIYFALTGLHAVHILGGIAVIGYLLGPGFTMSRREPVRFAHRVDMTGLYWHFVDAVWIALFAALYLS
jgi:cytochrome c oxidase subunit 3